MKIDYSTFKKKSGCLNILMGQDLFRNLYFEIFLDFGSFNMTSNPGQLWRSV